MLRINFFTTWHPDDELPVLVRNRLVEGPLSPWERQYTTPAATQVGADPPAADLAGRPAAPRVVAVGPFPDGFQAATYITEHEGIRDLAPAVVKALTSSGLQQALGEKGLEIEVDPVGFLCFDPAAAPDSPMPNAVLLRKGMRFRVDHLVVRGRRIYGFFVAPITRLHFTKDLTTDEALGHALIGERVTVRMDQHTHGAELRAVDYGAQTACVLIDSRELKVALANVRPRATTKAIGRYFNAIGKAGDARAVRLAPQIANYRLLPNGQRNRRWLAQQYEYVSSWLLGKSESGRLRFKWPQSDIELYVSTEAFKISSGVA